MASADGGLQDARRESAVFAAALDHVAEAVALLDVASRLVWANRTAMAVFRAAGGLSLAQDQRLLVAHLGARQELMRMIETHAQAASAHEDRAAAQVVVPRSQGRPVIVTVRPLSQRVAGASAAVVMLFFADPEAKPRDHSAALQTAYGLSPAESRLVQALHEGLSLKEVARRDDLSYETVRTYIKRVLGKTGARRQAELMRLTASLA